MKALFLVDNIPVVEMFEPIVAKLPVGWDAKFISYNGCTDINCEPLGGENAKGVKELIEREKPDVIVLAREETNIVEHLFATSGVPTLLVPHGALMPNDRRTWSNSDRYLKVEHLYKLFKQAYWRLIKGKIPIGRLIQTGLFRLKNDFRDGITLSRFDNYSKIATYGEAMRDILIEYKVNPCNIVITGNPKYHKYLNMGLNKSGKVLLITDYLVEFGLWSKKQMIDYLKDVCDVVYQLTSKNVQILIHPVHEDKREYNTIANRYNLTADIYQLELTRLIGECDMAITVLSTSGLEMMVAGKPLIIYNPYYNPTLYGENSGVYIAHTRSEFFYIIRGLLRDGMSESQKKLADAFVYQQTYLQDGMADERIVDLIVSMAMDGKRC